MLFTPYIFAKLYIYKKKRKEKGGGRGGWGGRERINNIRDNHSYIHILLYCMFIIYRFGCIMVERVV